MSIFMKAFPFLLEAFFMLGAGLSIFGVKPNLKKIAFLGCIQGIVAFTVRRLYEIYHIPLGTHSFLLILGFIVILRVIGKQKWIVAVVAPLASFLLLLLGEGVFMFNVFKALNINFQEIAINPYIRLFGTVLTCIPLAIVFVLGHVFNISVIDLNRLTKNEEV